MPDATKGPNLKKVEALLSLLKDNHDKSAAIIEEVNQLLGGGVGIAAQIKDVQHAFHEAWTHRYRGQYVWRHAVDIPHIKRLIKMLGVEEVKTRVVNYLRNEDPFIGRSRHPFGLFVSGINSYANEGPGGELELESPAVGCSHVPPCKSDSDHTRRKSAELRA